MAAVRLERPATPFIAQSFTVSQTIHFSSCCLTSYRIEIPDCPCRASGIATTEQGSDLLGAAYIFAETQAREKHANKLRNSVRRAKGRQRRGTDGSARLSERICSIRVRSRAYRRIIAPQLPLWNEIRFPPGVSHNLYCLIHNATRT